MTSQKNDKEHISQRVKYISGNIKKNASTKDTDCIFRNLKNEVEQLSNQYMAITEYPATPVASLSEQIDQNIEDLRECIILDRLTIGLFWTDTYYHQDTKNTSYTTCTEAGLDKLVNAIKESDIGKHNSEVLDTVLEYLEKAFSL
jgi:hypothetical protein